MSNREPFKGVIRRTYEDSTPWWPEPKRTVDNSPNVVVILFDDTGFSHFGTAWPPVECDSPIFTPRHCARPLGPAC